jgi:hypothetical protein
MHEPIPNLNLFSIRAASIFKAPLKHLLVRASLQSPFSQCLVAHPEEPANAIVESPYSFNGTQVVAVRKAAVFRKITDFIKNPPEDADSANLITR